MCGIVAGVSKQKNVIDALLLGLKRLEYRGYDSCGLAYIEQNQLKRLRTTARVQDLFEQAEKENAHSTIGIAHTRWATHGKPSTDNAHPLFSNDALALVHNGIIENHHALREQLLAKNYVFVSQTDTEVIAHLVYDYYLSSKDLMQAVQLASQELKGAYSIACFLKDDANTVVGAKLGSPLVLALGEDEHFLVSDTLAIAGRCTRAIYLEDGEFVKITPEGFIITDGEKIKTNGSGQSQNQYHIHNIAKAIEQVDLGPYAHYMQKEIFEQARAVSDTLGELEQFSTKLFGLDAWEVFANTKQILILACGTSYYAGCVARYWLESIANIPTQVEIASEYRYRESVANPEQLILVISQSGETADTLAALAHAKSLGHTMTMSICNVATSAMVRACQLNFLTKAGVEVGVASTKAFTTQLVALSILAYTFAKQRGHLSQDAEAQAIKQLRHLPQGIQQVLALEPSIIAWSEKFADKQHALFLGRGMHYPIAMEGALKLKEISYIHAEGYPAGELKHGPLALVTEQMPVVVVAPNNQLLEKLKSNIQEVQARGGELFVFIDQDVLHQAHLDLTQEAHLHLIRLPEYIGDLSPILHTVALQLLAYHVACLKGNDVDKPRNLAKSVTVE